MPHGRKNVVCFSCGELKVHYGLGMCSACLRRHKRQTKPSYYLGTCYSEMSRRVKTFDTARPNYFGKKICTKVEFIARFLNDPEFLEIFKDWQDSNFKRGEAPSIDRIDNQGDYVISNLQFLPHWMNGKKDWQNPVRVYYLNDFIGDFESQLAAAEYIGCSPAVVCNNLRDNKLICGFKVVRL